MTEIRRRSWLSFALSLAVFFVAASWILHTVSRVFVVGVTETAFMERKIAEGFEAYGGWELLLGVHAVFAGLAILFAVLSLVASWKLWWGRHRVLGRLYGVSVLISAFAGYPLAFTATGGIVSTLGFVTLNSVWMHTVFMLYRNARAREVIPHRQWAIRSFSVTMANTTLTVTSATLASLSVGHTSAYQLAVWLCLPCNLAIAEVWIWTFPKSVKSNRKLHS
ncbi:MAG: hypothetical protein Aurels2KO_54090 [Aureliella sp.]